MRQQIFLEGRPLHIFPCSAAKKPTTPHGFYNATADAAAQARLWSKHPGPLIGVATGVISGIDVIDIDPRRGGDKWFFENRDKLPKTRTHETQSFGQHLIYRHLPGLRCSTDRIAPGVEVKADGGLVIWWPAHGCRVLCEGPVADFPAWFLELARTRSAATTSIERRGNGPQMPGVMADRIPKPLYFEVLRLVPLSDTVTRHHQRRVIGILSIVTRRGKLRNDGLNIASFCFRELIPEVVTRDAAESLLLGAAQVCGYVAKDGVDAAMATIRSGLGSDIGGPSFFNPECTDETPA